MSNLQINVENVVPQMSFIGVKKKKNDMIQLSKH